MKHYRHERCQAYFCGPRRPWCCELKWLFGRPAKDYGINCIVFGRVPITGANSG